MTSNKSALIIGVDYGTTFTGVAFCEVVPNQNHDDNIHVVQDWPSGRAKIGTREKVPSEIAYENDEIHWGNDIPPDMPRHMWTKLSFDPAEDGEERKIAREIILTSQDHDKKAVDVAADFLREVKTHLEVNLNNRYGEVLWKTMDIILVISFPAVWSDKAKKDTRDAFSKAGFNSSGFPRLKHTLDATEPECAAIYTLKAMQGTARETQLTENDGFIICDMGGGTVDLISYRISGTEPVQVEEATVGIGAQCGGSFVDRAFLHWLELRLGTSDFVKIAGCRSEDVCYTKLSKHAARLLQDFYLEAKSGFSGTETCFLRLPYGCGINLDDDENRGISEGTIMILPEDMIRMFEFSIRRTYELISEQLQQLRNRENINVKYIFTVGGFSESRYVFNKIKEFAELNSILAFKPINAWSAIVRGAVAKGIAGKVDVVKQRKCRRFYGNTLNNRFIEGVHRDQDAFICQFTGLKKAENQIEWLLVKGQDLPSSDALHAKMPYHMMFWPGESRLHTIRLYASDSDEAPTLRDDESVYRVASLKVDLNQIPEHKFRRCQSPSGRPYHRLSYEIHISLKGALEYSLVVDGITYGSLTANYD